MEDGKSISVKPQTLSFETVKSNGMTEQFKPWQCEIIGKKYEKPQLTLYSKVSKLFSYYGLITKQSPAKIKTRTRKEEISSSDLDNAEYKKSAKSKHISDLFKSHKKKPMVSYHYLPTPGSGESTSPEPVLDRSKYVRLEKKPFAEKQTPSEISLPAYTSSGSLDEHDVEKVLENLVNQVPDENSSWRNRVAEEIPIKIDVFSNFKSNTANTKNEESSVTSRDDSSDIYVDEELKDMERITLRSPQNMKTQDPMAGLSQLAKQLEIKTNHIDEEYILIITNDELNDIEANLPTAKKNKFESLKAKLKGLNSNLRSNCMTGKLLLQQERTEENESLINSCKTEVENLQKEIYDIEQEIKHLKKIHPKLDNPYDF